MLKKIIKKNILLSIITFSFLLIYPSLSSANDNVEKINPNDLGISEQQIKEWDQKATELTQNITTVTPSTFSVNPGEYVTDNELEDGVYKIKLRDSDLYLDVQYATSKNGQKFNAWSRHNGFSQMFYIKNVGNGEFIIFDLLNWRAMEIQNSNNFNGAQIQLWSLHGLPTQRWKVELVTGKNGYPEDAERRSFRLINVNSGKALDLIGSRQSQGTIFWSWSKVNISSQKYMFQYLG